MIEKNNEHKEDKSIFSRLGNSIRAWPKWVWAFVIGVFLGVGGPALLSYLKKQAEWNLPQSQIIHHSRGLQ